MGLYRIKDLEHQTRISLDDIVAVDSLASIKSVCEIVECRLLESLRNFIIVEISLVAEEIGVGFLSTPLYYFSYNGLTYQLKLTEHSVRNRVLQITIQCTDQLKSTPIAKPFKIKFDSYGKYNEVHIRTDKIFLNCKDSIAEIAQSVLQVGYRWLVENVKKRLHSIQDSAAENLYSHLRLVLPEQIVNQIWLYAITDNKGLYILDVVAHKIALEKIGEKKMNVDTSPIKLVTDFSTTLLNFEKTFSNIAITEDKSLLKDFSDVPYAESHLQIAEAAIYQVSGYVVQPLVREGKTFLTAGYPINLRGKVEYVLQKEREKFKRILEVKKSKFTSMIRQLRDNTLPSTFKAELAEYAGRFSKGLFGL